MADPAGSAILLPTKISKLPLLFLSVIVAATKAVMFFHDIGINVLIFDVLFWGIYERKNRRFN